MDIKAIIFDCDGTLVDSEYSHYLSWRYALESRQSGMEHDEYFHYIGNSAELNAKLLAAKIGDGICPEGILADKRRHYDFLRQAKFPAIQNTVDFVHIVAKEKSNSGLKLGVASAGRTDEIHLNLKNLGIHHYFDIVVSGEDDLHDYDDPEGVNKPKPYIYLHTAKQLNVSPSQCVVIEDSRAGVTAAKDSGCFTIAIPNAYTRRQDLSHAHLKLDSLKSVTFQEFCKMVGLS